MTDLTWKRSKWIYGKINLTERVVCQQPPLSCHLTPQEPSEKTINFWRSAHKPTSSSSRFREDKFPFLFYFNPFPTLSSSSSSDKENLALFRTHSSPLPAISENFISLFHDFHFLDRQNKRMYESTNPNSVVILSFFLPKLSSELALGDQGRNKA